MMNYKLFLILMLLFVTFNSPCLSKENRPLTPNELSDNPEIFDGKHVTVRGYVVIGPESRNIFSFKESKRNYHNACLGLYGPNSMFNVFHNYKIKTLSGIFRKKLCGEKDICLFWCSDSGIELDKDSIP